MFDITVYPLVRLWRFYVQDLVQNVPTLKDISNTLDNIGVSNIYATQDKIVMSNDVRDSLTDF